MTPKEFWARSVRSLTPASYRLYRRVLSQLPPTPTASEVMAHVDSLYGRYAPGTIRHHLLVIGAYLNAIGLPAKRWLPRPPRAEPERYVATEADYAALLGALDPSNPRNLQAIVCLRLLWDTGCRVGELVSIPLKAAYGRHCDVRTLKTGRWRTLFWSAPCELAIRAWLPVRAQASGDRLLVAMNPHGPRSARLSTRAVQRLVERLRDALGLDPKLTAHSFRHSRIHRWLANGLNEFETRRLSGHRNPAGLEHYTRYGAAHVSAMAERAM